MHENDNWFNIITLTLLMVSTKKIDVVSLVIEYPVASIVHRGCWLCYIVVSNQLVTTLWLYG